MRQTCSIPGCGRPVVGRSWCAKHYKRWETHGDPLTVRGGKEPIRVEVGDRFGRLVVTGEDGRTKEGQRLMACRCDCGNKTSVRAARLRNGHTRSCGCLQDEYRRRGAPTHGLSKHPLYSTWLGIRNRCRNARSSSYQYYGGRGITVDPRWDDFATFLADVGERPSPEHSLDRIDVDGPYSPTNVRWATWAEQGLNRRPPTLTTRVPLDEETTALLDQLRGGLSRTEWVRDAIKAAAPPR